MKKKRFISTPKSENVSDRREGVTIVFEYLSEADLSLPVDVTLQQVEPSFSLPRSGVGTPFNSNKKRKIEAIIALLFTNLA